MALKEEHNIPDKISIENLIVFTLYSFSKQGGSKFEDLANNCFKQFPQIFSLKDYPQWLDTRKLDRPLRDLRRKKLIKGDPKTSFALTTLGKERAKEIAQNLKQRKLL